jgi:hypothetical protein
LRMMAAAWCTRRLHGVGNFCVARNGNGQANQS